MLPHGAAGAAAGPDPLHRHYRRRAPPVPEIAVDSNIAASWTVPGPVSASATGPNDDASASIPTAAGASNDRAVRTTLVRTAVTSGPGKRAAAAQASQPRRFHSVKDSLYVLPSDGIEMNRQKLLIAPKIHNASIWQHHVLRVLFQGIFHSPQQALFEAGGEHVRVLDMACGSAIWTREMATTFPRTKIVGVDMDPESHNRDPTDPPNLSFVTDNILRGTGCSVDHTADRDEIATFVLFTSRIQRTLTSAVPDNSFDLVFQRLMFMSIPIGGWPGVINELARLTKPGGYIELIEIGWNGPIGNMGRVNFESGTLAMKSFLAPALSMSEAEFEKFFKDVLEECAEYLTFCDYTLVVAKVQK
ncbi:hypothetical protein HK405_005352 [Cladochytrium tenue]|nr:hypothetical protein HK405_005352 [Cladochytrium tenue]